MAATVTNRLNFSILNNMFSRKTKNFGFLSQKNFMSSAWSIKSGGLDMFSSTSSTQVIQMTVKKMQAAITGASSGTTSSRRLSSSALNVAQTEVEAPAPSQWQIDQAVQKAGGLDAVSPWLVDGKTKLEVNGRKTVVDVTDGSTASTESAAEKVDHRTEAVKSIARFGFDASKLDGDLGRLREDLKNEAARYSQSNPHLSSVYEYALEDAYAKINAWENSANGASESPSYENQRQTNLKQAESIVAQLGLGDGEAWGITSMAEDLAVFGMDMTAMSKDPFELAGEVRSKSKEMLAELEKRYAGTEAEFIKERNRITGASARLVNGLEGARAMAGASASLTGSWASSKVSVSVGGTQIDANVIISVGNVIVDPLVLDLNGDGIDLKSAEEGVAFDMNGNGEKSQMGFIRGDNALLFHDTYGDGGVHDGRQLFGNTQGHANGFEMLAQYDENGDGVIDENDAIYDQLRVWVEKNEDGVCESEETMSLREAGIKSINLGYQNVREDDGKGNLVGQTGSFTRADGSEGYAADVWLQEKKA